MSITLIVEDGTGVDNANAYVPVAYVDSYHSDRGRESWNNFEGEKKKACIIAATDYVEKRFGRRFKGRKLTQEQALAWPRGDAFDSNRQLYTGVDIIPRCLKKAIAEYALRAGLVGELAPDPIPFVPSQDLTPEEPVVATEHTGGVVRRTQEQVGKVMEAKTFQTPDQLISVSRNKRPLGMLVSDFNIPEYPAADLLIEELIQSARRTLGRS